VSVIGPEEALAERERLVGKGNHMLLTVGAIDHRKNTINSLRALKLLPERYHLVLAGGDGAGQLDCAAVKQELLRQRRFAGVRMRDNGERAPFLDFFGNLHRNAKDSTDLAKGKGLDLTGKHALINSALIFID